VLASLLFASRKGGLHELTTTKLLMKKGKARGVRFLFPYRLLALCVGVAVIVPHFLSGFRIVTLTGVVAMVLLFSSLSLLVGLSRQVSLAHSVFVVFGATTLAHLLKAGVPYPLALLLAGLLFVPVGALIAIPAIRLSGLYLALATFAFALLSEALFTTGFAFGQEQLVRIPRPSYLVGDLPFFYFTLAVTVAGVIAVELIRVSRLGRMLTALADSPRAVQSLGMSPLAARVITFCVSAFLAAIAGGLIGTMVQVVSQDTYSAFTSLVWLTVLVAVGSRTLGGSVLAAVLFVGLPSVVESQYLSPTYLAMYLGVAAVFLAQTSNGLVGLVRMPDFGALAATARSKLESNRSLERYVRAIGAEGMPAAEVSR
jgi:ABC-type branched-subunit amino acid transport system permease subunit